MVAAVIFDLDGTVLANEDEYGAAFRIILARLGKKVNKAFPHVGGIGVKENWPILLSRYEIKTRKTIEELSRATQDEYLKLLRGVKVKRGFAEFIARLQKENISTALATSNDLWILEQVFEELSLDKYFKVTTTGEEVENKKPSPDLFLLTARKLGVNSRDCLVIEDSQAGIEAAKLSGMKVIGMARDATHAKSLIGADIVVGSFAEINIELIEKL
jgi:HAD superfamily hydrolase (TIGR01509 family)